MKTMSMELLELLKVLAMDKVVNLMNLQHQSGKLSCPVQATVGPPGMGEGFSETAGLPPR